MATVSPIDPRIADPQGTVNPQFGGGFARTLSGGVLLPYVCARMRSAPLRGESPGFRRGRRIRNRRILKLGVDTSPLFCYSLVKFGLRLHNLRSRKVSKMAQMQKVTGRSTSIRETPDGKTAVRYHDTDVVVFDKDSVVLDSGGWRTYTTKARMVQACNQFGLGFTVYQKDFEWFVIRYRDWLNPIPFVDGMILTRP